MDSAFKILIIDDDSRMCESLSQLLSTYGYDISITHSGKEALNYASENYLDLALVDIVLPDINGLWLIEFLKTHNSEIPVIIMTGYASTDSAVKALRKGAFDYLKKPIEPEELITTVQNALEQKKLKAECKKAEKALEESEEKCRTILDANPDPFVIYDIEGKVIYFNPAFTKVFGWTLNERLGKKMDIFVPEENWPETKMMIEKLLAGESFNSIETCRFTKNGDRIPVSISGVVYLEQGGKPAGSAISVRDIREQKRLETQLQQFKKMEAIGTLAGGIAHDFNNLLMGIQGCTSLMLCENTLSNPYCRHLNSIEQYIESATDLTRQLLGFARSGKYRVKPTDLNELLKKSSGMFWRTKKEITIHTNYQKDVWTVEVDQGQIEQVLLNLFVNASHAMPDGGKLYLQTENVVLDENYSYHFKVKSGRYVKISITDTGSGMDETIQERVFEPFFTTKEMGRGTGLGLAASYGIIKNHGGIIEVFSKKGKGTTFTVHLPASEKVRKKEMTDGVIRRSLKGTETILLVDDEEMIIDVGKQMLEKLGYQVLIAKNGRDAMEIYRKNENNTDMVILDMVMPDMGGGEAYSKLKEINPNITVLLSSGYSIEGRATEILKRGCDSFIQKPFRMRELSRKIREVLEKGKNNAQ